MRFKAFLFGLTSLAMVLATMAYSKAVFGECFPPAGAHSFFKYCQIINIGFSGFSFVFLGLFYLSFLVMFLEYRQTGKFTDANDTVLDAKTLICDSWFILAGVVLSAAGLVMSVLFL